MPAAVSNVSASVSSTTPSRAPAAQAGPADGQSFKDELDRAKNQGSSPEVDGGDSQASNSKLKATGDPGQPPTKARAPGKAGGQAKGTGKVRARLTNKAELAPAKDGATKAPSKANAQSDAGSSDSGNGQQQDATADRKPSKKTAASTDLSETVSSAASAPNQAAAIADKVPETDPAHLTPKAERDSSPDPHSTPQSDDPITSSDAANIDQIPVADASSPSTAESGARTARSSRERSANVTKGNVDPDADSTQNIAAAIQSIATSSDAGDSSANAAVDPAISGAAIPVSKAQPRSIDDATLSGLGQTIPAGPRTLNTAINSANDAAQPSPEAQFADANRSKIVSGITGKLLPDGGSMQLTLDPANLGPMQVRVEMKNGVMSATFETSNDQASKLLSHSLGDLKSALEAQGVTVEKLHVSQSSKQQQSSGDSRQGASDAGQNRAAQQEQQRKDMMRRMWRKLMKGQDPLDLVA